MKPTKIFIVLVLLSTVTFLKAQDHFVVKNATVFTGDEVIKKTSVLVENGMITKIKKRIKTDLPVIDGDGKFLMPGMTNTHVHAWMPALLNEAAKAGVLNVLDMAGAETFQQMMKNFKHSTNYARYRVAGYAATAPEGHGTQFGFPVPTLEKPEDAKQWVADRVKAKVDHIKIIVEPWRATLNHETVAAIIKEAKSHDKKVVVHVSKMKDGYKVFRSGADGLVHIWRDEKMSDGQIAELANGDFFVIPTILVGYKAVTAMAKKTEEVALKKLAWYKEEVKRLYDAGIPILAGTDPPNAGINMGTDLYKEIIFFSEAGIPNIDALRSATSLPADKFEMDKLGYIKEGFIADMIMLDGNPMKNIKDIEKINTIWKAGKKVKR
ncbi:amidohydrolase family protein [Spongiivirga citrea]|uniref:amidohydrolase family protein n=1 Tax=Spongiivirga citrea TaxID=1481457 RepID=UPI001EF96731|nr:amidohydrolase family protein [Spongiivirga citrea]